jgi:signal transduction histidine kinase
LRFTTHELKQPLGVLKGYLIMLQDETLGKLSTTLQKEAILEMRSNVNTLNDMIQKYLQLTKIEAGKLIVEKKRINLFEEAIEPVSLPQEVDAQCVKAADVLGLRYTGMDLKADARGRLCILELNPSAMFLGFDRMAGTDVGGELVNALLSHC